LDGVETLSGVCVEQLEDAAPAVADAACLRELAERDGFLFLRGLIPAERVLRLRQVVLGYAREAAWLDAAQPLEAARAMPGKRVGYYQDPDWIQLQVRAQTSAEFWDVGDSIEIHRALHAAAARASFLYLSTANTCRIFSPHPDMATQPHQDAHYVRAIERFWTAWIPLGDCPIELGPLAVLPGSHRYGLQQHAGQGIVDGGVEVPADAVWRTSDFRCGDALLFTNFTLHRSLANRSGDRLRLSADFRYGFWSD
jgi:hypothetical protein